MHSLESYLRLNESLRSTVVYKGSYLDLNDRENFYLGPFEEREVVRLRQSYLEAAVAFYSMFGFECENEEEVMTFMGKPSPTSITAGGFVATSIYPDYRIRFTTEINS